MKNRLGDILVNKGIITPEQLFLLLDLHRENGKRLGDLAVEKGFAQEQQVMEALSQQLGVPLYDVRSARIDSKTAGLISESMARLHTIIPIHIDNSGHLVLAMADPLDLDAISEAEIMTGLRVAPVMDTAKNILRAIYLVYSRQHTENALKELDLDTKKNIFPDVPETDAIDAPGIRLVDSVIRQAVIRGASDIHIEPLDNDIRVRIRVNGSLIELMRSPVSTHSIMVARIKILGHMNIAESRIPQDGRITLTVEGKEVDIRLSTLPTVNGEKVVMRILDHSRLEHFKPENTMSEINKERLRTIVRQSSGMVLVTGPTGSGKTTTLYSIINQMNKGLTNIITIEDPVEYKIAGINQTQVNNKAGYTFANGLRAILRQDPDVIMIGEIRDNETAEIAIRAAITGHLVLSTMHTQDSASTVTRLLDMKIEPHLLSAALAGIVAQRLIRRICKECKESFEASTEEKAILGIDDGERLTLYRGYGCLHCANTGYKDRFAVYEIMPVNKELRSLIHNKASSDDIRDRAREKYGLVSLKESLTKHILEGVTTTEEMIKVYSNIED